MSSIKKFFKKLFGQSDAPAPPAAGSSPCVCMKDGDYWYCYRQQGSLWVKCPGSSQYTSESECINSTNGQCP